MNNKALTKKGPGKYSILALIFVSVVINYMDRTNISVAAAAMSEELGLNTVQLGLIFSVFGLTYSFMQIPGGMIVDLVKVRILYPFILTAWSIATVIQGLVSSFSAILGCRIAIGLFEAPSYPANNKIVSNWFPEEERAGAIAVYTSGQFIGLAFLMPVLATIQNYFGWRGLFIISGLIGIVWAVIWFIFYRDPTPTDNSDTEQNSNAEPETVADVAEEKAKVNWANILLAFSNKKLWGIYIGQFCLGSVLIFFLTWFPTYLAEYRGFANLKAGFLASIPFLAAFFGVLLSGFVSDYLARRGISKEIARKAPVIFGLLLSCSVIGANFVDSTFWVVFFLSLSFFGNGLASIAWVFVSLLAPKNMVGLVGGCFNFCGALSSFIIPFLIGILVQDGDFAPALVLIAGLAGVGVLSYLFLVGKVEQVDLSSASKRAKTA